MPSQYSEVYRDSLVFAANDDLEMLIANITRDDFEAFRLIANRRRGEPSAFSTHYPKIKEIKLPVKGHKGLGNKYQIIYAEAQQSKLYILSATDLRTQEPFDTIARLSPDQVRLLQAITGAIVETL